MNQPKVRTKAIGRDDSALWRRATRDVARLPDRPKPRPASVQSPPETAPMPVAAPTAAIAQPAPSLDRFAGIDRANAERLKRGRRAIEARLDLHGSTQEEAHRALAGFVIESRNAGRRCVLV